MPKVLFLVYVRTAIGLAKEPILKLCGISGVKNKDMPKGYLNLDFELST